jgi:hypothetical protein
MECDLVSERARRVESLGSHRKCRRFVSEAAILVLEP